MTSWRYKTLLFLFTFLTMIDLSKEACSDYFNINNMKDNLTEIVSVVRPKDSKDIIECTLERQCQEKNNTTSCYWLRDCFESTNKNYADKTVSEKCEGNTSYSIGFYHFMCLTAKAAGVPIEGLNLTACEYETVWELYSEIKANDQTTTLPPTSTTSSPPTTTSSPSTTSSPPPTTSTTSSPPPTTSTTSSPPPTTSTTSSPPPTTSTTSTTSSPPPSTSTTSTTSSPPTTTSTTSTTSSPSTSTTSSPPTTLAETTTATTSSPPPTTSTTSSPSTSTTSSPPTTLAETTTATTSVLPPPTTATKLPPTARVAQSPVSSGINDTLTQKLLMMSVILNVLVPLTVYLYMRRQRNLDHRQPNIELNEYLPGAQPVTGLQASTNGDDVETSRLMQPPEPSAHVIRNDCAVEMECCIDPTHNTTM